MFNVTDDKGSINVILVDGLPAWDLRVTIRPHTGTGSTTVQAVLHGYSIW